MLARFKIGIPMALVAFLSLTLPPVSGAKSAKEIYQEKLAKLRKSDVSGHYRLGQWCKRKRLAEEAKDLFEKVIALSPDHSGARRALGYVKWEGEWLTKAEKSRRQKESSYQSRLSRLKEGDAQGRYSLALWCKRNGLYEEARELFRKVLSLNPEHTGAKKALQGIADSLLGELIRRYIAADEASRAEVQKELRAHEKIDPMKVGELVDLVQRELGKRSKHSGEAISVVQHGEHTMKYR
ncbi:MAG: tetratricopeptide repeat protein, partial [Planctomycetota bacterium]